MCENKSAVEERIRPNRQGSPVFADGKIYSGEARHVSIIKPIQMAPKPQPGRVGGKPGREYVIYGPAVAHGRVIIQAASKTYCIGDKNAQVASDPIPDTMAKEEPADKNAAPAVIQVVPADVLLHPGQKQEFVARAFDNKGRFLKEEKATWSIGQLTIPTPPGRVPEIKKPNLPKGAAESAQASAPSAASSSGARIPVTTQPAPPPGPVGNLKGEVTADGTITPSMPAIRRWRYAT
jgi:hypothetical protein